MAASTVPAGLVVRGAGLPVGRRPGQPARAAPVPVRHGAAHRGGVRAAGGHAGVRRARPTRAHDPARPTVGVVFYRAHELSGNTAFVDDLCDAIEARGANALPVFCGSLRGADPELMALLGAGRRADRHRAGRRRHARAADASAGGDEDAWDAGALAALDVPVLQGLCLTTSRAAWADSDAALSPMDAAMQVAIPEFDGRLITVPFSFKETGLGDDIPVYGPTRSGPPGWPGSRCGTPGCATIPVARAEAGGRAVQLPDQARPGGQRGRAGHPGLGGGAARRAARGRLHGRRVPDGLRRADPHADRGRRARRGVADRGAAGRRAGPGPAGRLPALVRRAARPRCATRCASTGASRRARSTSTAATSCWPRCGSATCC